jgi:hypothetical protein
MKPHHLAAIKARATRCAALSRDVEALQRALDQTREDAERLGHVETWTEPRGEAATVAELLHARSIVAERLREWSLEAVAMRIYELRVNGADASDPRVAELTARLEICAALQKLKPEEQHLLRAFLKAGKSDACR